MRCFLLIGNINKIDLCMANIEENFHLLLASHFSQSNIPKSALCLEKSTVGQQIILNRSIITRKKSLLIITPSIRPGQVINKLYKAGSPIMKVLRMIMNV